MAETEKQLDRDIASVVRQSHVLGWLTVAVAVLAAAVVAARVLGSN